MENSNNLTKKMQEEKAMVTRHL